jgi:hypothetical protein
MQPHVEHNFCLQKSNFTHDKTYWKLEIFSMDKINK